MARQKGSNNFAGTLEILAGGPVDARSIVPTKADLTASGTFDYPYIGMTVVVQSEGKSYILTGADPTDSENWKENGGGGGAANVQSDWNEADDTADDYIKNKPTLGTAAAKDSTNAVTQGSTDLIESGAVYSGLAGKVNTSSVGTANGVAELDANGKVPASQLPSFVDDVIDGYYNETDGKFYEESTYQTEIPGESDKIYISVDTDIQYRWSGSAFSALGGALTLGETSSTAYRGDRGKAAYDFSQTPYSSNPEMNGTASAGSATTWAKGDHVHPSDTAKADKVSSATNGHFAGLDANGNLTDSGKGASDFVTPTQLAAKQDALTAGDGISIANDEISTDNMPSTDMSEIVTPLPGVMSRRMKYSLDEQVVGEWIDGKPIYQKTIDFGALPNTTAKTINHGISNIDKVIYLYGIELTNDNEYWTAHLPNGGEMDATSLYASRTQIYVETLKDKSGRTAYVTLQYTKTTD